MLAVAKQEMTAASFAKAVQAFDAAMALPRLHTDTYEHIRELVRLHSVATEMEAILAKKEEGELWMRQGRYDKALWAFDAAMGMPGRRR